MPRFQCFTQDGVKMATFWRELRQNGDFFLRNASKLRLDRAKCVKIATFAGKMHQMVTFSSNMGMLWGAKAELLIFHWF